MSMTSLKSTPWFPRHGPLGAAGPEAAASLASIMVRLCWSVSKLPTESVGSRELVANSVHTIDATVESRRRCVLGITHMYRLITQHNVTIIFVIQYICKFPDHQTVTVDQLVYLMFRVS